MKKTAAYLITGFLGSGKTTFLKQVIDSVPKDVRIAIIQNEFAPANIDGNELRRTSTRHFEILEINNGSVFCVCLLSGFITSLKDFVVKYQPDILLLEASGLADPVAVGEIFHSPVLTNKVYLAGSICIIDAVNFLKQHKLIQRIQHQVKIADTILINKTDLNPHPDKTINKVKKINPFAKITPTLFCKVSIKELFDALGPEKSSQNLENKATSPAVGRPDINSAVFRSTRPLNHIFAETFLKELSGISYRVKGYLQLDNEKNLAVQAVFKDFEMKEVTNPLKQTELIAMGYDVDVKKLKELYDKYRK
ncbi:MAG: GTP-binding protein [Bacteroidales bacterium]|nr:GTP-binding protein [Bacteroidales bacterium]